MKRPLYLSILSVALLAGLTAGCSDDKSDDGVPKEGLTLSGDFGSAYAYYQPPWYERLVTPVHASSSYDAIENSIAIPIASDRIMMDAAIPLDIKSDGTFTAEITKEYGWIVLLDKGNGNYSFLSVPMSVDSNDSLITFFPKTDVDFGKIEYKSATDEAESESNASELAEKFIFSLEQLGDISKSDDAFKAVANSYRNNYGKSDKAQISEVMHIVSVAVPKLEPDIPVMANKYQGFMMEFEFGPETLLAQNGVNICDNTLKVGLKYPDESFKLATDSQDYLSALMSGNMVPDENHHPVPYLACAVQENFVISYFRDTNSSGGTLSFFRGESTDMLAQNLELPNGLFTLQLQDGDVNTSVAKYELNYNLPMKNGELLLPVPEFTLHKNGRFIDYVDVKWYLYNPSSGKYKGIEDFTSFAPMLRDITSGMWLVTNGGTGHDQGLDFNEKYDRIDMTTSEVTWADVTDLRLRVQYDVGNTHMRFQATNVGLQ